MPHSLEVAVARLVAIAKANNDLLKVATAASSLAREYESDPHIVAQMITNYGRHAGVNMEMSSPASGSNEGK